MNEIQVTIPKAFEVTKENAADTLDKIKIVQERLSELEKQVKEFALPKLLEKEEIQGLALKYGNQRRSISDVRGVYKAIKDTIQNEDFVEICKVGIGDLEKLYKKSSGLSQVQATVELANKLGDLVQVSEGSPSIVLTKQKLIEA